MTKQEMFDAGVELLDLFCSLNDIKKPTIHVGPTLVNACAYYRPPGKIQIDIDACAKIGNWGPAWSFPGYVIDRTPYGVLQHELGHHVDYWATPKKERGKWMGVYGKIVMIDSAEKPISGYCPNPSEWFAEIFRLFVTNPDLLKNIRPKAYALLCVNWKPVITEPWHEVIADAPERTIKQAAKKIREVRDKPLLSLL